MHIRVTTTRPASELSYATAARLMLGEINRGEAARIVCIAEKCARREANAWLDEALMRSHRQSTVVIIS